MRCLNPAPAGGGVGVSGLVPFTYPLLNCLPVQFLAESPQPVSIFSDAPANITPNDLATMREPNIMAMTRIHWKIADGIPTWDNPGGAMSQPGPENAQKALGLSLPCVSKSERER